MFWFFVTFMWLILNIALERMLETKKFQNCAETLEVSEGGPSCLSDHPHLSSTY